MTWVAKTHQWYICWPFVKMFSIALVRIHLGLLTTHFVVSGAQECTWKTTGEEEGTESDRVKGLNDAWEQPTMCFFQLGEYLWPHWRSIKIYIYIWCLQKQFASFASDRFSIGWMIRSWWGSFISWAGIQKVNYWPVKGWILIATTPSWEINKNRNH